MLLKCSMVTAGRPFHALRDGVTRAYERGVRGYIGRVEAVAFSFGARIFSSLPNLRFRPWAREDQIRVKTFFFALRLILGKNWDQIWLKTFFCSSPDFGEKLGPNLSEELFIFYFCYSPNLGEKLGPNLSEELFFCSLPKFGGPASISVSPQNFSLRPWV